MKSSRFRIQESKNDSVKAKIPFFQERTESVESHQYIFIIQISRIQLTCDLAHRAEQGCLVTVPSLQLHALDLIAVHTTAQTLAVRTTSKPKDDYDYDDDCSEDGAFHGSHVPATRR